MTWDKRLTEMGVTVERAKPAPGEGYWRLIDGVFYDEQESGGRHHIFFDVLDGDGEHMAGAPMLVRWQDGTAVVHTKDYMEWDGWYGNYPMRGGGYSAAMFESYPTDIVHGMSTPANRHVSYGLRWQWIEPRTKPMPEPEEPSDREPDGVLTLDGETYHIYKVQRQANEPTGLT